MPVAIDNLSDALQRCPHFDLLVTLCKDKQAYIVGGALRDVLLNRPLSDLDLIFPHDPTPLARSFASKIGGHWFWLDRERRQSRVVIKDDAECPYYDFAPFRAPDLARDLLDRDFTINALALPLQESLSAVSLVDPGHGLEDLQRGQLRMVGKDSFANDPLRIVKGIRHATTLGLEIEESTLRVMQAGVSGLDLVATERIRQEVWKIFSHEQATDGLRLLQKSGVGRQLFGQGYDSSLQMMTEKLEACRERLQQLAQHEPSVSCWLGEDLEQGLNAGTMLLFALVMASLDPGLPIQIAERWQLSRRVRASLAAVIALDEVALSEFGRLARTERAYAWWALRHRLPPRLLLLALTAGTSESILHLDFIQAWLPLVSRVDEQRPTDLVDGHWLRRELDIEPGPEMTKALELLRNNEISGNVCNERQAKEFLCRFYQNKD